MFFLTDLLLSTFLFSFLPFLSYAPFFGLSLLELSFLLFVFMELLGVELDGVSGAVTSRAKTAQSHSEESPVDAPATPMAAFAC